ncbi:Y-family DNA polymerase [Entomomonas asaccharolytica]|uniref:Y-family DNA polymerase n=1 Tax=Entomomonas asaccharolytica TaxID=2785331 RepID=A0A974NFW3_9GAMM|nr:Y-family DNA polymerase [Entomomonas asaccharolytica]QQP85752.1 Y-family DNA polymerase [Entomomonas asaccharolytica]
MIGLIDCNNFYASCERVFNPSLVGKPIGILSNNDGCIIARSNEIKPLVPMGMPAFKIPNGIQKQITLLSSNYELYGDMSYRVFNTIREHTADLEIYSIDEAFVHLEGFGNPVEHCKRLRHIIKRNTGIPVSIGLSSTRTLAKIANHVAKKNPDYEGVCWLHPTEPKLETLLKNLPVSKIWGVGYRIANKLQAMGITTAWQLKEADPKYIRKQFSVILERTVLELQGIPCIVLDDLDTTKKNIMTSRSFGRLTGSLYDLHEAIRVHSSKGAEKLRKQNSVARAVLIFLKTNRFRDDLPQYNPSIVVPLPYPTNDTREIIKAAQQGLKTIYKKGYMFMKAGVMMLDLTDKDIQQFDIFSASQDSEQKEKSNKLNSTVDMINKKMGRDTIRIGGIRHNAAWIIKRDLLSKRYTTRWDEIPIVK